MKSRALMFLAAFAVWCLLSWPPTALQLAAGAAASLLAAAVMGRMFITRHHMLGHPMRILTFIFHYMPVFTWELIKANFDVAYRVLHPGLPINPGIVKLKTGLKSDMGLTFLANSITLTPGTLTVDVDKEQGILYIHWIYVRGRDIDSASRAIGGRFEPILRRIFEEVVP